MVGLIIQAGWIILAGWIGLVGWVTPVGWVILAHRSGRCFGLFWDVVIS